MGDRKKTDQSNTSVPATTSVVVLAAHRKHDDSAHPSFKTLIDFDLAAETASLDAGRVSQVLAADSLPLANLQPGALPKLLQRP